MIGFWIFSFFQETGQCIGDFGNNKVPYCVTFYPVDNNIFLVGCSNKKVVQYDLREGSGSGSSESGAAAGGISQEYNHHLAPVNTVTFFDQGRRFASTSDDKKVLVWEFNIPVPIKYVSEPGMHSMPAVTSHPSGEYMVGQSLDNQICTFGTL